MSTSNEFVGLKEAALALGISRASAYTWALAGRLPAKRVVGRYLVRRRDLDEAVRRERPARAAVAAK